MKYIFAIDETGTFAMHKDAWSFACGVFVNGNEYALKQAYQKMYEEMSFPAPTPTTTEGLLKTTENINDNARFHYNALTGEQKEICRRNLMPFVQKIYVSKDKPVLYANNQNWWLIAITVIIREFLRDLQMKKDDEVEIWIDNRTEKVWGVVEDENDVEFKEYHNILKQQIINNVKEYVPYRDKIDIKFRSDTSSFFINLADIMCGFMRKDRDSLKRCFEECSCKRFNDGLDPVVCKSRNPLLALNIIYQEVDDDKFDNISHLQDIIERLRKDEDDYEMAWDIFYDFLKDKIAERRTFSSLIRIKPFVQYFLDEYNKVGKTKLPASKCIDITVLFVEYYSHSGELRMPFERAAFYENLKKTDAKSETRILFKWGKLLSFTLRESQIYFNNYDFTSAEKNLLEMWEGHDKIVSLLKEMFSEKDEHTTALLGSLAQSYAYKGDFDTAIEYFRMSKDYSVRTTNISDSYIFTIYHRNKDVENARMQFKLQVGKNPEEYYEAKKYDDVWKLLSYCKLRALELYVNGKTDLLSIDLEQLDNYNTEYPFPLVMKWEGIALYLENKAENRMKVEKYFKDAIENLLNDDNGFTINTLALPIMQCYSFINNQNDFHAKYKSVVEGFKRQSSYFEKYVDDSMPALNDIKNDNDLWGRSMLLPFIYS